ncbi:SH3 domain-containing protein [Marssonina coronariae]|uniref:SH3 domain-containing protein n=1 Tax=Diplocarpon coronariae TaxID=2795749 RepID=A0A218YXJ7_9HELO|nr:SH3 domain-containing protein [Marssonina coronariae]
MSSPPFKVKAVYEYTSPHDDDLHFPLHQIITVTDVEDDDWYNGNYVDASGVLQEGIFPKNFVERFEPTAPPRPTRAPRQKKEVEPDPEPAREPSPTLQSVHEPEPEPEPEREQEEVHEAPAALEPPPSVPNPQVVSPPLPKQAEYAPLPTAAKPIPISKPSAPPPAVEKPGGGSFRDRIAAFNKAAPPPAPFKPAGFSSGGSNNFIKKPFVAPPPSKNAYVPVARDPPPQKIYRREEDPEVVATQTESQEQAERAGLAPTSSENDGEEQPIPTSLKERIALLQKQQLEQASRHAEAAHKKEKPKRPVKKRSNSHEVVEGEEGATLERRDTETTTGRLSVDSVRESTREDSPAPRKRRSLIQPRKSFGDGNEADMSGAGDITEEPEEYSHGMDDSDEKPKHQASQALARAPSAPVREPGADEREGALEEGEEEIEEEDDIDPEVRRKEELRARMAKMSGGMGMHGMFGGGMPMPAPVPPKKKKSIGTSEKRSGEYGADDLSSLSARAPPVPMIPLPGLSQVRSPDEVDKQLGHYEDTPPVSATRPADEVPDIEEVIPSQDTAAPLSSPQHEGGAPPIPSGRPGPPPVPIDTRPAAPMSPSAGSESDDELSSREQQAPPAEAPREPPRSLEGQVSPKSSNIKRMSYFGSEASPSPPVTPGINKRLSRLPPPIPGAMPTSQPHSRAPPHPTSGAVLTRAQTNDQHVLSSPKAASKEENEEEVTEYEGDYDTDIASAAPYKDALKAAEPDDGAPVRSPTRMPVSAPPPFPSTTAPRAIPPPLPAQAPPVSRQSFDVPRAAPPPPPSTRVPAPLEQDDDEYDPYKYAAPKAAAPAGPPPRSEKNDEDLYSASPPRSFASSVPQDRPAPQLPPSGSRPPARKSLDISRSATTSRRSVELGRMSMDSGFVANDVDLAPKSLWWTQPKGVPPVFSGRRDIALDFEESSAPGRGGTTIVTKHLYVLFQDYSQTIITVEYDAQDPKKVRLEQRHDQPPSHQRQDQLEQAHEKYGRKIIEAVYSKKETVVGDGTPQGLVKKLLEPFSDALLPIGTRAYGAIVYSNLANASTQQSDEIRAGDIITLRNTKFQGKHGPMHAKYSIEVGKPDHVGVVAEWDGTKKKVRAWEQGRESRKVKLESFKLDDLRSGEVKIWRVMPRSWVGWHGPN